jgi:hypothetical protein
MAAEIFDSTKHHRKREIRCERREMCISDRARRGRCRNKMMVGVVRKGRENGIGLGQVPR